MLEIVRLQIEQVNVLLWLYVIISDSLFLELLGCVLFLEVWVLSLTVWVVSLVVWVLSLGGWEVSLGGW